jgi:predicted permease
VLLHPLPYANGDRIVTLTESVDGGKAYGDVTLGNFDTWRKEARSFEALGAEWGTGSRTLTGVGDPTPVSTMQRTSGFWKAQFIPPVLGRYFEGSDEQLNAPHVVVLSTALWKNRFNSDPTIVGKTITLNSAPWMVVGIAPPDYILAPPAEMIWIPLVLPPERWNDHGDHELAVAGLVRQGVSTEQAVRELSMIDTRLAKEYPNKGFDGTVRGQSPAEQLVGSQRRNLYTLLGAVGLVLLIACGNVANLLLARGTVRRAEIAIRGALGASRRRIVGQLLIESLLLGIGGGVLGLAVAAAGVKFLVRSPAGIPRLQDTTLNAPVLLFTFGLSVVCALVFGLWPALRASRLDLQQTLRDGGRESAASVRDRARGALVVSELCLAQLLLVGAGLMIRSMLVVLSVPPGFATKNILMMNVQLPSARYPNAVVREAGFARIREAVAAVPGVRSAGFASMAPIHGRGFNCGAFREGSNGHDDGNWQASVRTADPSYFNAIGIPLLRGRTFTVADNDGSANVAIINRSLAVKLYGNADPIGRRVANCIGGPPEQPVWREIVGVVGDVHANGLSNDTPNEVYTPTPQFSQSQLTLVVRSNIDTPSLLPSIRRTVAAIDPMLPLAKVQTMEDAIGRSLSLPRFNMWLLTLLGATGLILAVVGIYGVISYFVTQRTRELGVRMALGASTASVRWMIVRQGLVLGTLGVAIGSAVSYGATRLMRSQLFGVTTHDPVTFTLVSAILVATAVAASYLPARRATRIDPLEALRG